MEECVFCRMARGDIPVEPLYRNDKVFVVRDINPQAPTHLLVIPKEHVASAFEVENAALWSWFIAAAVEAAKELGLDKDGCRFVVNTGVHGGQTVPHLHLHILAGRNLGWPPG
jgi:histidine triad (HIT) family protein